MPVKEQLKSFFMIRSPSDAIRAPVTGKFIPLQDVPDEVFSQNVLGEGMAFSPVTGLLFSPVSGKVSRVLSNGQVIWLEGKGGITILLQIGLKPDETKSLQVRLCVKKGDPVQCGNDLAHFELESLTGMGFDGLVIMVVTAVPGRKKIVPVAPEYVVGGRDDVFRLSG